MNNPGTEETRSYRNIFKATTLFGGVQFYQIIIQIVRSKFVAVLLGTSGMGIQGMYQSTLQFLQSVTSLGLSQSAVRDVSEANNSGDTGQVGKTVATLRKLVWFTGLSGMILFIVLSPVLSKLSFGNYDYTIPFALLSVILLIDQLASGQKVVLQGMRRLKDLARASAIGVTAGLALSVPLYYAFGVKGIVPTLILNSVISLIIFWVFSKKITFDSQEEVTVRDAFFRGKEMVSMGIAMSASGILATAVSYVVRAFIMREGGSDVVGLFQAGFVIINTYVGMVFNAMGTDFYPRLAAVNKDDGECRKIISQQGEIASQIMSPLLCGCILLMPILLHVLYSDRFLDAGPFVLWCCPGMMFKLASWLIAYQFVAKADTRLFIVTELISNVIYLALSLLGFRYGGLRGMGIAFTVNYLIYLLLVYAIASRRYGFSFSGDFLIPFFLQFLLVGSNLAVILLCPVPLKYWAGVLMTVISCVYALVTLGRKTNMKGTIKELIDKKRTNG